MSIINAQIQAIDIPCKETKLLGFADDTSLFANSNLSLETVFKGIVWQNRPQLNKSINSNNSIGYPFKP